MRKLFFRYDNFLSTKTKREQHLLFWLPIVIFGGVVFGIFMPHIDEFYESKKDFLRQQQHLHNTLLQAQENQHLQTLKDKLQTSQKSLFLLSQKAFPNTKLKHSLTPFSKQISLVDSNLSLYAVGDVSLLEDILEEIERHFFVFIENVSLNAYFSSDLEIRLDIVNMGNML